MMKHLPHRLCLALALILSGAAFSGIAVPVQAAMVMDHAETPMDTELFASLVAIGGGPEHFRATVLRKALEGKTGESKRLRAAVGEDMLTRYDAVFTKVVNDELAALRAKHGGKLPPMHQLYSDPKSLAHALYCVGLHADVFSVERAYDALFSSAGHQRAMTYVAKHFGSVDQQAWHVVFAKLIVDRGSK